MNIMTKPFGYPSGFSSISEGNFFNHNSQVKLGRKTVIILQKAFYVKTIHKNHMLHTVKEAIF